MVTDAFLSLLTTLITAFVSVLPAWVIVIDTNYLAQMSAAYTAWDAVLPVHELATVSPLMFSRFASMIAIWLGKGLINIVRGSGA